MSGNNNVNTGQEAVLLLRNIEDTEWMLVGGVTTRGTGTENQTEQYTSSSTSGSYHEYQYTGFSDQPINVSGKIDNRSGETMTIGGQAYTVVESYELDKRANTGDRCAKIKLIYPFKVIEGNYVISSYNDSGDTGALMSFDATFQPAETPTITFN